MLDNETKSIVRIVRFCEAFCELCLFYGLFCLWVFDDCSGLRLVVKKSELCVCDIWIINRFKCLILEVFIENLEDFLLLNEFINLINLNDDSLLGIDIKFDDRRVFYSTCNSFSLSYEVIVKLSEKAENITRLKELSDLRRECVTIANS